MSFYLTDSTAISILRGASATDRGSGRDILVEEVAGLFDRFRGHLLHYLSNFGLAIPDCEDVLQESFLALFQYSHDGKSRENIRRWLFLVADSPGLRNRNAIRRDSETSAIPGAEDLTIDPKPEDEMATGQTQGRLAATVAALREQDRRCLFLRSEGFRYREIAEILDVSPGGVFLSLSRWKCRVLGQELETAIVDFVRIRRHGLDAKVPPVGGPRALLRARISQLSSTEPGRDLCCTGSWYLFSTFGRAW